MSLIALPRGWIPPVAVGAVALVALANLALVCCSLPRAESWPHQVDLQTLVLAPLVFVVMRAVRHRAADTLAGDRPGPPPGPPRQARLGVDAFYLPVHALAALDAAARRHGLTRNEVLIAILIDWDGLPEPERAAVVWQTLLNGH